MKTKILFLLSLLFLVMIKCSIGKEKSPQMEIKEITLSEEGLDVLLQLKLEQDDKQVLKVGVLYGLVEEEELRVENALDKVELPLHDLLQPNDYLFSFHEIQESHFNKELRLQPFIVFENDDIEYSKNVKTFNLYELSKQSSTSFANFIVHVVEDKLISEIMLEADYTNYSVKTLGEGFTATLKTDYNKITITINIEDGYLLRNEFQLIINGKTIEQNKITHLDNAIIYKIDDPNWTKPY